MLDCNIYGEYNSRKVKDSFRFNSFDVFESFEGEAFAVTLLVVLLEVFLRRNLSMIKAPKSRHDRGTLIRTDYIRKKRNPQFSDRVRGTWENWGSFEVIEIGQPTCKF